MMNRSVKLISLAPTQTEIIAALGMMEIWLESRRTVISPRK